MRGKDDTRSTRAVAARIDYLAPDSRVNRRFVAPGAELNTGRFETHEVRIHEGRSCRDALTLDGVGFELLDHRSAVRDFLDRGEVDRVYPAEVVAAVSQRLGADRVAPLGWMMRTSGDKALLASSTGYTRGGGGVQPPAADVHVDMHWDRVEARARAAYLRCWPDGPGYRRFIVSSFWRCFSDPPQDWPLALCDGTSLEVDEGVANTMVVVDALPDEEARYGPLEGEERLPAASVFTYRPQHRWWYFPDMTRDEALLFKFYDSDHSVAWRCPHTAFHDTARAGTTVRRSIEFRTFAFFDA